MSASASRSSAHEIRVLVDLGGADTRVGSLATMVDVAVGLRPQGVKLIFSGRPEDQALSALAQANDIDIVAGWSRPFSRSLLPLYAGDVLRWLWRLNAIRPQVVHQNHVGWGHSVAFAAYLMGIPVVARAGGEFHPANPSNRWIRKYVAHNETHAEKLLHSPLADRVFVAGHPFSPRRLLGGEGDLDQPPAPLSDRPRFLFLGQIVERKGLDVLIEAFARMTAEAELLLVGGDWAEEGYPQLIRQMVERRGLEDRVRFQNHQTDVSTLLRRSDVFVLPSRYDTQPRSLMEAMYFGLAVVSTSVGGILTTVEHDTTGLLVPPDDPAALAEALDSLAVSPEKREALGRAARDHIRQSLAMNDALQRYLELYRELAADSRFRGSRER